jgi:hypothetical protein
VRIPDGRKRVIGIMAAILTAMHMRNGGRSVDNSHGCCAMFTQQVWRLRKSTGNLRL